MPLVGSVVLGVATYSSEGCLTDACKESFIDFGKAPGQGSLVDENTWQSTPVDGDWQPFPHQARVEFFHPLGRVPYEVLVWISASKNPLVGSNYTLAGGDVATVYKTLFDVVSITNGTCADYYVRVVVRAPPRASAVDGGVDGGAEVGAEAASSPDASETGASPDGG
jgi:hypothetical protein